MQLQREVGQFLSQWKIRSDRAAAFTMLDVAWNVTVDLELGIRCRDRIRLCEV